MIICDDCAMAAVNNDYTGMDPETENRVRAGLESVGYIVVDTDSRDEFSWHPCQSCGTVLGGGRYTATSDRPAAPRRRRVYAACPECGRSFDLGDPIDSAEWHYGHDCEA